MDIMGIKKVKKKLTNNDVLKKILIFNCKDENYDRYLYLLNNKDYANLINFNDNDKESNLKFIRYLDIDMMVKIGIISIKK